MKPLNSNLKHTANHSTDVCGVYAFFGEGPPRTRWFRKEGCHDYKFQGRKRDVFSGQGLGQGQDKQRNTETGPPGQCKPIKQRRPWTKGFPELYTALVHPWETKKFSCCWHTHRE